MSAALYKTYTLPMLANLVAEDLNRIRADRTTPVDSVAEMIGRLRAAAAPLALPSENAQMLAALRLATRGGLTASAEAIREFSAFTADRLNTAVRCEPPEHEYAYLIGFFRRVATGGTEAVRRMVPVAVASPPPVHC